jgi:hypothetical protein
MPGDERPVMSGSGQASQPTRGDRCADIELTLARKSEKIFVTREICHAEAMQITSFCMAAF